MIYLIGGERGVWWKFGCRGNQLVEEKPDEVRVRVHETDKTGLTGLNQLRWLAVAEVRKTGSDQWLQIR